MANEDRETRYYNQRTGKEEWRYRHCSKTYSYSGGTATLAKHLTDPPLEGGLRALEGRALNIESGQYTGYPRASSPFS